MSEWIDFVRATQEHRSIGAPPAIYTPTFAWMVPGAREPDHSWFETARSLTSRAFSCRRHLQPALATRELSPADQRRDQRRLELTRIPVLVCGSKADLVATESDSLKGQFDATRDFGIEVEFAVRFFCSLS